MLADRMSNIWLFCSLPPMIRFTEYGLNQSANHEQRVQDLLSPLLQYLSQIHPIHLSLSCDPNPSHHLSPRCEVVFLDPLFLPSPSEPCNQMIFLKHRSDYHGAAMASHGASDQAQLPTTDCKAFHSAAPLYLFLISNTILFFPLF